MRILFKIALFSILLYLTLDIGIRSEEKAARPIVQAIGGLSLLLVSWYNLKCWLQGLVIHKLWSFIKLWRIFVGILLLYYSLSFLNVPTDYADSSPRNMVIAIYIFAVTLFFITGLFLDT